jgi:glyoxylase-like metal-dependent hydrolase (beta-lactamase superfamily II)
MVTRRGFLGTLGGCAAHLLWMSSGYGAARKLYAAQPLGHVAGTEPWARVEELGPGVWSIISTPLAGPRGSDSWRTVCNGGIIAGRSEVLLLEAFTSPEGARWAVDVATQLTGRRPTLALVTHYHGDHTTGIPAYAADANPVPVRSTPTTRGLLQGKDPLPEPVIPDQGESRIDLGGRVVKLVSRVGHTPSDVTIEVDDPQVVFCGDLVWNGMFPNYRDAIPSRKAASVRALLSAGDVPYVPGHGGMAKKADLERYLTLLDDVGEKAKAAIAAGTPLDQAADSYQLPAGFEAWVMFSPTYFRVAFQAWGKELGVVAK